MVISIGDQLQSISGDLLGARVALDAEWWEILEQHHYDDVPDSKKFVELIQMLTSAQANIDKAREILKEL